MSTPANEKTDDPNWPVDYVQDARWQAPRIVALGIISLLCFLGIIYTAATVIGEHRNNFHELDHY